MLLHDRLADSADLVDDGIVAECTSAFAEAFLSHGSLRRSEVALLGKASVDGMA